MLTSGVIDMGCRTSFWRSNFFCLLPRRKTVSPCVTSSSWRRNIHVMPSPVDTRQPTFKRLKGNSSQGGCLAGDKPCQPMPCLLSCWAERARVHGCGYPRPANSQERFEKNFEAAFSVPKEILQFSKTNMMWAAGSKKRESPPHLYRPRTDDRYDLPAYLSTPGVAHLEVTCGLEKAPGLRHGVVGRKIPDLGQSQNGVPAFPRGIFAGGWWTSSHVGQVIMI